ncbi:LysR substrate-binding domain-containing protein [Streptomyces lydicus]|uniref:LysR substrate-binding domain-containing protein n=1 Tax=Streptomyces lydicus TaxID=47763 RepID=UPI0036F14FFC
MKVPRLLDGRLKFRHLLLIDALARQGSVVGAAAELHVTQPVATRGLHEMEDILGVPLFKRGPRGVTPTPFGEAFTHHARAVIAQMEQASRHVVQLSEADRGTVIVGAHLAGSNILLPQAIVAVKAQHPHLTIVVREASPDTLLIELEAGRLDFIVGRVSRPTDERFERRRLHDESVVLVTRASHPLVNRTGIQLSELRTFPWILPGSETPLRRELDTFFARNDVPLPVNRVETTSFLTVRQLLLETDAIAPLPRLITQGDTRFARLAMGLDPIGRSIGLVLAVNRTPNPPADALIQCLTEVAATLGS